MQREFWRGTLFLIGLSVMPLAAAADGTDPAGVDLSKLERRKLTSLPKFTAEKPLYALAVMGQEAKTQVWMILDKSAADAKTYDLLWADLSGDGSFDPKTERFVCKDEGKSGGERKRSNFELGEFIDPATKDRHTNFAVSIDLEQPICMIKLHWQGKADRKLGGGYAPQSDGGYMRFAASAAEAPLVWFNGDGPFRFQRWYSEKLRIGGSDELKLFLGQEGLGKHTFCAFTGHVLPDDEPVQATLVYADKEGKERRKLYELKGRC